MTQDEIAALIPANVKEEAAAEYFISSNGYDRERGLRIWNEVLVDRDRERYRLHATNSLAAGLAAWGGMTTEFRRDSFMGWDGNLIILPIQEPTT